MTDDYLYDMPALETDYTVEEGDSIAEIARDFDTSIEAIADLNPDVNVAQVTPGQNLRLQYRPRLCAGGTIYVVRRGETLASIAARFGTTEAALRQANPFLDGIRLRAGLPICIPPRPTTCPGGTIYIVRAGDTLVNIAARFGTSVGAIIRANPGLNPSRLFVGQRICIPVTPPRPGVCPGGTFYTIMAGDTLFSIATRFGTTVEAIIRANPGIDPFRLFVGERICIPRAMPRASYYPDYPEYYSENPY